MESSKDRRREDLFNKNFLKSGQSFDDRVRKYRDVPIVRSYAEGDTAFQYFRRN